MYLLPALHFEHPRLGDDEDERVLSDGRSELNYLSGGFGGGHRLSKKTSHVFSGENLQQPRRLDSAGSHSALG